MPLTTYLIGPPTLMWEITMLVSRISSLSGELLTFGVAAASGGLPVNPTDAVVEFAFKSTAADPEGADWQAGAWDTTLTRTYVAGIAPGAGGVGLTAGEWYTWIRITADEADPIVRCVATLIVE